MPGYPRGITVRHHPPSIGDATHRFTAHDRITGLSQDGAVTYTAAYTARNSDALIAEVIDDVIRRLMDHRVSSRRPGQPVRSGTSEYQYNREFITYEDVAEMQPIMFNPRRGLGGRSFSEAITESVEKIASKDPPLEKIRRNLPS